MASKSFSDNPSAPGTSSLPPRSVPSIENVDRPGPVAPDLPLDAGYSGILPPPQVIRQYDEIEPGRGVKLLNLMEEQTRHRMDMERQFARAEVQKSWMGIAWGLGGLLFSVLAGSYVAYDGHPAAGATIATTAVVGLIVFGIRLQKSRAEIEDDKNRKNAKSAE